MAIEIERVKILPETPSFEKVPAKLSEGPGLYWLVFSMTVPAHKVASISSYPQLPFRGKRFAVNPTIAPHFEILEFKVGVYSQRINEDHGCPATLFPPLPHTLSPEEREDYEDLLAMRMDAASVGQPIAVTVRNTSPHTQVFSAVLWGISNL
jgi:hypothetical protein